MNITAEMLEEAKRNNPGSNVHVEDGQIIVEAVGSMMGENRFGAERSLSKYMEAAMVDAVNQALTDGVSISDSEKILEYKRAARERVRSGQLGKEQA